MSLKFEKIRFDGLWPIAPVWGFGVSLMLAFGGQEAFANEQPQIRPPSGALVRSSVSDVAIPPESQPQEQAETGNAAEGDAGAQGGIGAEKEAVPAAVETQHVNTVSFDIRPPARSPHIPKTRWQHMQGHSLWTRAAISALKSHGSPLVEMVPRDIANWCPAYSDNDDDQRRAFWVGYMSALAKHESTYKPWAVGGGGRWYGLLQILPATARGYKCNVGTGEALKNGAANLSCAVRIMAFTVKRDGVIHGRDKKWRGVSADWGPMRSSAKRQDMAGWLKRQNYCRLRNSTRPKSRP